MREPRLDKKHGRTIFFKPLYVEFFNWNWIGRCDGMISVPPSRVWNRAGDSKTFPARENCK